MNNIMLDIETMGTSTNAAIISIGACYFDPETGEIGGTFHEQCSLKSSMECGLTVDSSTVVWWLKQDELARSKFYENEHAQHINECLIKLATFIDADSKVWGNGSTFDNSIIRNAYNKALGYDTPWKFWNDRDVRTVVEIGQRLNIDPKRDMIFDGVKHDALSDAIHQAKYVSAIWQHIVKGD